MTNSAWWSIKKSTSARSAGNVPESEGRRALPVIDLETADVLIAVDENFPREDDLASGASVNVSLRQWFLSSLRVYSQVESRTIDRLTQTRFEAIRSGILPPSWRWSFLMSAVDVRIRPRPSKQLEIADVDSTTRLVASDSVSLSGDRGPDRIIFRIVSGRCFACRLGSFLPGGTAERTRKSSSQDG